MIIPLFIQYGNTTDTLLLLHKSIEFQIPLLMTVYSYHVTYAFQSESTLYSCLNVKELLARNRREI